MKVSEVEKLLSLLTVRQVIEAGPEYIEAAGLNPWCINEGLANGSEPAISYVKMQNIKRDLAIQKFVDFVESLEQEDEVVLEALRETDMCKQLIAMLFGEDSDGSK